ncbi:MAG: hypothetical protein ACK52W_05330 [Alphaproteobacteria bacterium]
MENFDEATENAHMRRIYSQRGKLGQAWFEKQREAEAARGTKEHRALAIEAGLARHSYDLAALLELVSTQEGHVTHFMTILENVCTRLAILEGAYMPVLAAAAAMQRPPEPIQQPPATN